ncbi:nucleotide exchange factor GrpE [Vagococcus vulneris]|uniref:Protein GrpE n=1 Tax=Vagococcus vulneris TaxID=1977869 RepID=A0A429ZWY0_9ENTE|nr:nucleotide exchange factor GrpE [Vagococcus vulneris]RST98307.1 nucleotide exchange factor GrpE [Vagococcus vulneris]
MAEKHTQQQENNSNNDECVDEIKECESEECQCKHDNLSDEAKINEVENELKDMEDKFLRAQAEIANMRNRNKKEREDAAKYRAQDLAKSLLPALDNLDRALAIEATDEHGESMKKGIEMVRESVIHALNESNVEEIEALGQPFDPNLHQAVQTVPCEDGQEPDEIVQILQKGYILKDRVLRPTMVVVTQ